MLCHWGNGYPKGGRLDISEVRGRETRKAVVTINCQFQITWQKRIGNRDSSPEGKMLVSKTHANRRLLAAWLRFAARHCENGSSTLFFVAHMIRENVRTAPELRRFFNGLGGSPAVPVASSVVAGDRVSHQENETQDRALNDQAAVVAADAQHTRAVAFHDDRVSKSVVQRGLVDAPPLQWRRRGRSSGFHRKMVDIDAPVPRKASRARNSSASLQNKRQPVVAGRARAPKNFSLGARVAFWPNFAAISNGGGAYGPVFCVFRKCAFAHWVIRWMTGSASYFCRWFLALLSTSSGVLFFRQKWTRGAI